MPPQLLNCCPAAPQSPSFIHPQHTSNRTMVGGSMGRESTQRYQTYNPTSTESASAITASVSRLIFCPPTLPTPVHCHPIRGYLLDLSHQLKTHSQSPNELCWISSFPLFRLFLFRSPYVFIQKKEEKRRQSFKTIGLTADRSNSSQFNPQPKTTTGLTGHTRVPGLVPPAGEKLQLYESEFTVTISGWFMGLYLGYR